MTTPTTERPLALREWSYGIAPGDTERTVKIRLTREALKEPDAKRLSAAIRAFVDSLSARQPSEATVEAAAKAIAESYGQDPDEDAPLSEMTTAANQPVPWWRVYEEQARAALSTLHQGAGVAEPGDAEWVTELHADLKRRAREMYDLRDAKSDTALRKALERAGNTYDHAAELLIAASPALAEGEKT